MQRTVVLAKKLLAKLHFLAQEVMPFLLLAHSAYFPTFWTLPQTFHRPSTDLWADVTVVLWMLHASFGVVKDVEPRVWQGSRDYSRSVWKDR